MKKLKITKPVTDKVTKLSFQPGDVIERDDKRAEAFIKAGVAEEVKGKEASKKTEEADTADTKSTASDAADTTPKDAEASKEATATAKAAPKKKNTKK